MVVVVVAVEMARRPLTGGAFGREKCDCNVNFKQFHFMDENMARAG